MKVWVCIVLIPSLWFSVLPNAHGAPARNVRINVSIEKAGYEQGFDGRTTTSSERTQQFLMTLEGHEATIFVGRRVPNLIPIRRYLVENHYVDYAVQLTDVGTQLRALPRIRGEMIEIELTPEISYQAADARVEVIQMEKLSSTVSVRNGQTIQVGSVVSQSEFADLFYRSERGERLTIFLTPEIIESDG